MIGRTAQLTDVAVIFQKRHTEGIDNRPTRKDEQQCDTRQKINPAFPFIKLQLFANKADKKLIVNTLYAKVLPKSDDENGLKKVDDCRHYYTSK